MNTALSPVLETTWAHGLGTDSSQGVVVGFDGSRDGLQALRWAADAAERRGGRLTVATAYTAPYGMTCVYFDESDVRETLLDEARKAIRRLELPECLEISICAEAGSPVHMLLGYARTADLVVVGRSGGTGLGRLVLGSVSSPTAAMAQGPVAVVPPGAATTAPDRIIACVDPEDDPALVLSFAFEEGRASGRPVTILHALEPSRPLDAITQDLYGWRPRSQRVEEEMFDLLAQWSNRYTDVDRTVAIRRGAASTAVLEGVSDRDLLVLGGWRHPRAVGRLRSSVPDAVLRRSPCPAVIVHSRKES